jgi:hypothetical protein
MTETLTVLRLGVPPTLARTLRSTNSSESMISIARTHSRNVKHWENGQMALCWCAAGMTEAGNQFRRINGHLHLPALRKALEHHVAAETVSATRQNESRDRSLTTTGPAAEVQRRTGHPRRATAKSCRREGDRREQ